MPQLDALSIIIGFILGGLFKVPWLYKWYRQAARDKEHARRIYCNWLNRYDRIGSRVEDENEIVGDPV